MRPLFDHKLGIGPMSKNVVDACIEFANTRDVPLMLIPSRRQVEAWGGYSNGWTTKLFTEYVRERTDKILLVRDHGGPGQGEENDDGLAALTDDCRYLDLIHIDPWKVATSFEDGCKRTKDLIEHCYGLNSTMMYEVGTEQSIFPYDSGQLGYLLHYLCASWEDLLIFRQVKFAVIQGGTSLQGNRNTGDFDRERFDAMVETCKWWGVLSKAHNGDYLPSQNIQSQFAGGLNALNIAPQFGQIETQTYLDAMGDDPILLDYYHQVCHASGKWKKWFPSGYKPTPIELINVCGHYVISTPEFQKIKDRLRADVDEIVKTNLIRKLDELSRLT